MSVKAEGGALLGAEGIWVLQGAGAFKAGQGLDSENSPGQLRERAKAGGGTKPDPRRTQQSPNRQVGRQRAGGSLGCGKGSRGAGG